MTSPMNTVALSTTTVGFLEESPQNAEKESSEWNARVVSQVDKDSSNKPSIEATDSLFASNAPTLTVKKPISIDEEVALCKNSLPKALHNLICTYLDPTSEILDLVKSDREIPDYFRKLAENVSSLDLSDPTLTHKQVLTSLNLFKNIKSLILPRTFDLKIDKWKKRNIEIMFDKLTFSELILKISTLRNLEEIDMSFWLNSEMKKEFPGMYDLIASGGKIRRLNLSGNSHRITNGHISCILKAFKDLEYLNLNNCNIHNSCLTEIKNFSSLKSLELENCKLINDEGISNLSDMFMLEHLNISGLSYVTNIGLEAISKCYNLRSLNIARTNLSEKSLESILTLTNLTHLDMGSCRGLDDSILKNLVGFPKLQFLDVSDSSVSDESLPYISKLSELEHLDISETSIRRGALENLYPLKKLKILNAYYIPITSFDTDKLMKEIPGIVVNSGQDPRNRHFRVIPIDTSSLPSLMSSLVSNLVKLIDDL